MSSISVPELRQPTHGSGPSSDVRSLPSACPGHLALNLGLIQRFFFVRLRCRIGEAFGGNSQVIWVDYPGPDSLRQIYGTFNRAMLKLQPQLDKSCGEGMTNTMVQFWRESAQKFTSDQQPHYLYSPRGLIALEERFTSF